MTDISTINSLGGYPLGAENDSRAPFNEKPKKKVEVNVTVSVTYSKTLNVVVEEGYELPDLIEAVQEMKVLPNDILEEKAEALNEDLENNDWMFGSIGLAGLKSEIERCRPWHEDELEVIPNGTETHLLF